MNIKQYYGPKGRYLKEHQGYFSNTQLNSDVDFIIDALKLDKADRILDLACGHGRHTIEIRKRGFDIDGLDFSNHLIKIARKEAKKQNLKINFYRQNIHKINVNGRYNKIFLFFSEFGFFDHDKTLKNIKKILKPNGLFLLDIDNVFRLIKYLSNNSQTPYYFDFEKMLLREKKEKDKAGVRFYVFTEIERMFKKYKLKIISVWGDYQKKPLGIDSKRVIVVAKKV